MDISTAIYRIKIGMLPEAIVYSGVLEADIRIIRKYEQKSLFDSQNYDEIPTYSISEINLLKGLSHEMSRTIFMIKQEFPGTIIVNQ